MTSSLSMVSLTISVAQADALTACVVAQCSLDDPMILPLVRSKGGIVSPSQITGLNFWLKADAGIYQDSAGTTPAVADGDVVGLWQDFSGNGYHVSQDTAGKKPLLKLTVNGINGKPTILYDGVDDILVRTVANWRSSDNAGSIFIVYKSMGWTDYRPILASTDAASNNYYANTFIPYRAAAEPWVYTSFKEAGTTNAVRISDVSMLNVPYLGIVRSNGSAWTIRINGADKALTMIAGSNNGWWFNDVTERDNLIVGGSINNVGEYPAPKIKISEVLVYNRNITGTELTIIENYINRRYNIWADFYNPYLTLKSNHYKVQLHTHTTGSDGAQSPTDLMTAYKNSGYDAVAITDHDTITADPAVAGITYIPGCEEGATGGHIPCLFLTARETSATDQTVINTILGQGGFVEFAHPNYTAGAWTTGELNALYSGFFLEVYNAVVEQMEGANGYAEAHWDWLLTNRVFPYNRFFGLAVDDCHDVTDLNSI